MAVSHPDPVGSLARDRAVVVCAGPGGVGKTTISAAIALQAARDGRRSCVITVDPARRLADALGVGALTNTPATVEGDFAGTLHALMLDTKGTFDELVDRHARTEAQGEAIRANRIYQNLTGMLSGTQEYMAMEKLYELTESGDFDIVVVDTPPTRNALDLLDAPRRLTRFLDNRLFRALLAPTRASLRVLTIATQALLKTISRVAGAEIVQDAVDFFQAFEGMEEGFSSRAAAVRDLLAEPSTAYVLVTSPRPDSISETAYFAARLGDTGVEPAALIVNRVHPEFGTVQADSRHGGDLGVLLENHARLSRIATEEAKAVSALVEQVAPSPVARLRLLDSDVHDLEGLGAVADLLFGPQPVG
ncbi:MAG: ArsA family ATPase [Acidimicrobiales bacterium]